MKFSNSISEIFFHWLATSLKITFSLCLISKGIWLEICFLVPRLLFSERAYVCTRPALFFVDPPVPCLIRLSSIRWSAAFLFAWLVVSTLGHSQLPRSFSHGLNVHDHQPRGQTQRTNACSTPPSPGRMNYTAIQSTSSNCRPQVTWLRARELLACYLSLQSNVLLN